MRIFGFVYLANFDGCLGTCLSQPTTSHFEYLLRNCLSKCLGRWIPIYYHVYDYFCMLRWYAGICRFNSRFVRPVGTLDSSSVVVFRTTHSFGKYTHVCHCRCSYTSLYLSNVNLLTKFWHVVYYFRVDLGILHSLSIRPMCCSQYFHDQRSFLDTSLHSSKRQYCSFLVVPTRFLSRFFTSLSTCVELFFLSVQCHTRSCRTCQSHTASCVLHFQGRRCLCILLLSIHWHFRIHIW
mmetsp:Transcript_24973/g.35777  ORF Transcript_24973/g.35777 Transcript_24973/m.35777 type:complete len:237 (+) Transcript_24973:350-1060(+)